MTYSNLILETNLINSNVIQNYENDEGSNSYEENSLLNNTKEVSFEDSHDQMITQKIQKRKNIDKDNEIDNQEINNFNKRSKIETKAPYALKKYFVPPRIIDCTKVCGLSTYDPRNKLYYAPPSQSSTKCTIEIPLNSTSQIEPTQSFHSKNTNLESEDQEILEIHAPEFDSDL